MTTNERTPLLLSNNNHETTTTTSSWRPPPTDANGQSHVTQMPPLSYLTPILLSVWIPVFIASLDSTIVATLLNSISSSFGHSEQSAWLGTAYLLSFAAFSPIYARLCDIVGRKTSLLVALTFFLLGTVLCGVAASMDALVVARAVAGVGGGGIPTIVSVIMSDLVPLKNRGLLQGLTNVVFGVAAGLGGPLGGWMNDTTGWRVAFLVQVPLLFIAYICIIRFVPGAPCKTLAQVVSGSSSTTPELQSHQPEATGIAARVRRFFRFVFDLDIPGNVALITSIVTILTAFSLMSAEDRPLDDSTVLVLLIVGVVSLLAFVALEWSVWRREASHGSKPVLPLRLLATRTGAGVAGSNFFLAMFSFSILYQFPLLFQTVRLQSASVAGLHLIPNSVALSVGSVFAGWYMRKTGRFYWFCLANAVLLTLASVFVARLDRGSAEWWTYVAIVPSGFGIAAVLTCTLIAAINDVQRKDVAVMTGMTYLFRSNAQVLGVALSGVLLQTVLKTELRARITNRPDAEAIIAQIRHQASIVPHLRDPELREAAVESYRLALRTVFDAVTVVGVGVVVFVAIIRDVELPDYEMAKVVEDGEGEGDGERLGRDADDARTQSR